MNPNIEAQSPRSENYKVSFEEYKLLLDWTSSRLKFLAKW